MGQGPTLIVLHDGPWRDRPDEALAAIRAFVRAHDPDAAEQAGSAC